MNATAAFPSSERVRLRASDFELLHHSGALADVRRAELIDGDIYAMSPQTTRHARIKTRLATSISAALVSLGSDLEVVVEVSVVVADHSVPEPDIAVSGYQGDRYMPAETVALVVEVSTTTLEGDLGRKAELYAAAGIPEYWVVDANERQIITHARPRDGGYAERKVVAFGDIVESAAIAGLLVDTTILHR